jgi:hydrogenase maturation protein HypF
LRRRAIVSISGLVQGIGFRPFVYRLAVKRDLKGYVKNLGDAGVEIDVNGEEDAIKAFLRDLKEKKIPIAIYTKIDVMWHELSEEYSDFTIDDSDIGKREIKHSLIPPDVSICPKCLKELFNPSDRHHHYPFTCCALCGPRFTTIMDLPYDRERTTMVDFPLCEECSREFYDPLDRRFNAQTICCPECGPKMTLYNPEGSVVEEENPIIEAAKLLEEGYIVAVKGIGGIHLVTKTTEDDPILTLRERRRKPGKPFAIMSPSLEEVERYAVVSELERGILTSYARPIVALSKLEPFPLSAHISPGLHTVGVMLPYSGIHHLLFHQSREPALVMTSANFPGEPMVITNIDAFQKLKSVADYLLLHNREIYTTCDDSVLRVIDEHPTFLRRSRGYVPTPISLPFSSGSRVVAVGPELASTASILKGDKCYLTQHLGDIESPGSLAFLQEAIHHLMKLLRGSKPDAVACDLHPAFLSRAVASDLVKEFGAHQVEVQHHHAHLASLMAEAGIEPGEEIVSIVCDGYGYGSDGAPWGGEILVGGYEDFQRAGHLEPQPMPGGDLCAIRYGRMLQGVLYGVIPNDELGSFLSESCLKGFSMGEREIEIVFNQLEKGINTPLSTSAGRLLDAVSCLLGVSYVRTYEGEGAMKLEAAAVGGSPSMTNLPIEVEEQKGALMLKTSQMIRELLKLRSKNRRGDLAYAFQEALAEGLAKMALKTAEDRELRVVGFTGGVANNNFMTGTIRRRVEAGGLSFLHHHLVPCGDGGLSLGQAAVASFKALSHMV